MEYLHSCVNCDFYDRSYAQDCKETSADEVSDKEKKNFCDYFVPRSGGDAAKDKKEDLLAAAEALFKKS